MNAALTARRPTLVLVGPPGAGKTTVGRVLARRLGVEFTDVDELIVVRAGKSIADMFLQDGEDAFRVVEREVVAQALGGTDGVLALGGGSVLAPQTRERLRGHRVVHLSVGLAEGMRRTGMSTARPLLAGVNPRATFKALLAARVPLYREVATVEVDTVGRTANQVVQAVLVALGTTWEPTGLSTMVGEMAAEQADRSDPLDHPTPHQAERGPVPLPTPTLRADGDPAPLLRPTPHP